MSDRASGVLPLRKRQAPHVRLRVALREIAREIAEDPPGLWSIGAEAAARTLCGVIANRADRPPSRDAAVLVGMFERRFALALLRQIREDDLERVRMHAAERGRA